MKTPPPLAEDLPRHPRQRVRSSPKTAAEKSGATARAAAPRLQKSLDFALIKLAHHAASLDQPRLSEATPARPAQPARRSSWPLQAHQPVPTVQFVAPPSYAQATCRPSRGPQPLTLASAEPVLAADAARAVAPAQRPEVRLALPLLIAARVALGTTAQGPRKVELWLGGSAAHRALGLLPSQAWVDDLDPLLWVEDCGDTTTQALAAQVAPAIELRLAQEQLRAKVIVTHLGERDDAAQGLLLVQIVGEQLHIDLRVVVAGCTRRLFDIPGNGLLVDFFDATRIGAVPGTAAASALTDVRQGLYRGVGALPRDGIVRIWRAHQKGFVPAQGDKKTLEEALQLAATLMRHIHPNPWAEPHQLVYERGIWANRLLRMQGSRPLAPLLANALLSLAPLHDAHPQVPALARHLGELLRQRCLVEPKLSAQLAELLLGRAGTVGLALWGWALAQEETREMRAWDHAAVHITAPSPGVSDAVRMGLPDTCSFVVVPYGVCSWLALGASSAAAPLSQLIKLAEEPDDLIALAQLLGHPKLAMLAPAGLEHATSERLRIAQRLLGALKAAHQAGHGKAWQERLVLAIARTVPWHAAQAALAAAEPLALALRRHARRIVGAQEGRHWQRLVGELAMLPTGRALDDTWPTLGQHLRALEPNQRTPRLIQALTATHAAIDGGFFAAEQVLGRAVSAARLATSLVNEDALQRVADAEQGPPQALVHAQAYAHHAAQEAQLTSQETLAQMQEEAYDDVLPAGHAILFPIFYPPLLNAFNALLLSF